MPVDKSKSKSAAMATKEAFRMLGLSQSASINDINQSFKKKLASLQSKYADQPTELVSESDNLYRAYRAAYLSKDDAPEDQMLPLEITGPDNILNLFNVEVPHQSMKMQMQSQAHYKDGQLVRKESSKTESFINKEGKREIKVYENGKLIQHTVDGKNMLK